jgi:hypothetical protein
MNWYKIAITEKDFYDFYGYSVLDLKDIENNPNLLSDMIQHLNYIREYYLKYLSIEIGYEIYHGLNNILMLSDEEYLEIQNKIPILYEKFKNFTSLTDYDFNIAYSIFKDYDWDSSFGGDAWAEITKWTKKLYEIGEVKFEKSEELLFNKIQKLIMIIDTIHSLEHNTNMVLADLPENENMWMQKALDIIKSSKTGHNLVSVLNNKKLKEQIMKNRMLSEKEYDPLKDNVYKDFFEMFFDKFKEMNYNYMYNHQLFSPMLSSIYSLNSLQIRVLLNTILNNFKEEYDEANKSKIKLFYKKIFLRLASNKVLFSNIDLLEEVLSTIKKVDESNELICKFIKEILQNNIHYKIKNEIIKTTLRWAHNNNCYIAPEYIPDYLRY